jgi:hypothetical protein
MHIYTHVWVFLYTCADFDLMDGTKELEVQMEVMEGNKRDMGSIIEELRLQVVQFQDRESQTKEALLVKRVDNGLLMDEVQVRYIDVSIRKYIYLCIQCIYVYVYIHIQG